MLDIVPSCFICSFPVSYHIVLYRIVLYPLISYRIALYCIVLYYVIPALCHSYCCSQIYENN